MQKWNGAYSFDQDGFQIWMSFLPPSQQRQSTEEISHALIWQAFVDRLHCSESQPRADSPDAGRPKTLQLDQSSTQQSRSSSSSMSATSNSAALPSHLKTRRSLATESVRH